MSGAFSVCQLGARMHYAVPAILHRAGQLDTFYTDLSAQKGWLNLLRAIPRRWRPTGLQRVLGRVAHGVPAERITAFNSLGFEYYRRRKNARTPSEFNAAFLWAGKVFCEHVIRAGLNSARGVYVFNTAGLEVLRFARERGMRTVVEQTIAPNEVQFRLLAREQEKHPGWEPVSVHCEVERQLVERERGEWQLADLILCGSEFVRESVTASGGPAERCAVVPYGVDISARANFSREKKADAPLRVLTVGEVGLRKGSPYVVQAAQTLGRRAQFRMIGAIAASSAVAEDLRRHVDAPGAVPRSQMPEHYAWADVFLLPSICEGSATATYEALAHGLPVIATPNTGSVVRDGVEGFIISSANSEAIVEKIEALSADRALLAEMSCAAARRAEEFTLAAYGERLLRQLNALLNT